ncbi:MAG TPA: hypothetical protein VE487_02370, partial [Ilumatobacter sp.]|nr:hypothetical protein [Ilumatobacter sp.]
VTGAFMAVGQQFFDTNSVDFRLVRTTAAGDVVREYRHFSDVVGDTIDARVWLGIHFRSADEQGAFLGKQVAAWLAGHAFAPAG